MTDPRPAEGPDRHDPVTCECQCAACMAGAHQACKYDWRLPSPPAPGGDDAWREGHDFALWPHSGRVTAQRPPCPHPDHSPAPGGGDTDLRAVVEHWTAPDSYGDETLWTGPAGTPEPILRRCDLPLRAQHLWPILAAALAARPDADRDALARVEALADAWEADPALAHSYRYVEDLRAALSRDTEGSGE